MACKILLAYRTAPLDGGKESGWRDDLYAPYILDHLNVRIIQLTPQSNLDKFDSDNVQALSI